MLDVFSVKRSADRGDVLKALNGQFYKTKTITGTGLSLEDVESGSIIFMEADGDNNSVALPSKAEGLYFTFVQSNATAGSTYRISPDSAASIVGTLSTPAASAIASSDTVPVATSTCASVSTLAASI